MTRGKQDISSDASIKLDGITYLVDTWYKLTSQLNKRQSIFIRNQGVDNDLVTGNVWLTFNNTGDTETVSITNAKVTKLGPGESFAISPGLTEDITVNVQGDTLNGNINVIEIESHGRKGPQDW